MVRDYWSSLTVALLTVLHVERFVSANSICQIFFLSLFLNGSNNSKKTSGKTLISIRHLFSLESYNRYSIVALTSSNLIPLPLLMS